MGVRCQDHLATGIHREPGKIGVEVLAARKAVDLDRDTLVGTGRKDLFPPRPEPWPLLEVAAARVGEDVNARGRDRAEEAVCLVAVGIELSVNR